MATSISGSWLGDKMEIIETILESINGQEEAPIFFLL